MGSGSSSRLKMQVGGKIQPLSFDVSGASGPLLQSSESAWSGLPFELHRTLPASSPSQSGPPEGEHQLMVIVEGAFEVLRRSPRGDQLWRATPGSISFHSGAGPAPLRIDGSAQALVIDLEPDWVERMLPDRPLAWPRLHGEPGPDETARSLAFAMCSEVEHGAPSGALFADSLSLSLVSYALDRIPFAPMEVRGSLSERQRRKLTRYIDERLAADLRLPELAALCGLRPRHFTKLFRNAFGMTPHRYVVQRRLEQAARMLSSSECDLCEISILTGFSSQSHFTTAFRQAYGLPPGRYATHHRRSV